MASKGIPEKFHPPVTLILPKRRGLLEQTGVSSFHGYTIAEYNAATKTELSYDTKHLQRAVG